MAWLEAEMNGALMGFAATEELPNPPEIRANRTAVEHGWHMLRVEAWSIVDRQTYAVGRRIHGRTFRELGDPDEVHA